jgi:RIO kinase 1
MRIPECLVSLADQGIIQEVVRPLMSGKEAEVFLVVSGGELRVAKVYKEAQNRSFKNRAEYTEGRKVRNSRDQRAIGKRSRHGRAQDEAAWRSTEVDMIYRLRDAGVRVPTPHHFIEGVLIMEMVTDAEGNPAPRLGEVRLEPDEARVVFDQLVAEVVRMLCAGVVHGDLSDFNVLMGVNGPVVIDFPQAVDASSNQNARTLLLRDVGNLQRYLARFVPGYRPRPLAEEMWALYASSMLTPETRLRGEFRASQRRADTDAVLELIGDANYDERRRRETKGISMRGAPAAAPAPTGAPRGNGYGGPPRDRAPTHAPRGDAPMHAPRDNAPRGNAPMNAPRDNAPRGNAPMHAPRDNAPRGNAPMHAPRDNAPRGNAPMHAPRDNAHAGPPRGNAPMNAPRGNAPMNAPRGNAPVVEHRRPRPKPASA